MKIRLLCAALIALTVVTAAAQTPPAAQPAPTREPARDALGRSTPRGTLLGFLAAARKGDNDLARHYLDTPARKSDAEELARQLFVVLDARLPARLTQVSDQPEGSRANPLAPDEDRIGQVDGPDGPTAITVRRVKPRGEEPVWLFAQSTLAAVPAIYEDIQLQEQLRLPRLLTEYRVGHVRIAEWLAILFGVPAFYLLTLGLNRALRPAVGRLSRRGDTGADRSSVNALPGPARVLLVCLAARWLFASLSLSLLVRQFLNNVTAVVGIVSMTWLAIMLLGEAEHFITRRMSPTRSSGAVSLLRVGRRCFDVVLILAGVLAVLRHFGVDPTPLLAGLGVGGIAVALAAQKTLENIIAGASLIFDQAVRVGDSLKVGAVQGTVEHIGLRSTRIRTADRSIVSVPNSQIANMSLETLSARDKYWFHPVIALTYETTEEQMTVVLDGIRQALTRHPAIDRESIRVRFQRLGVFSLDVEVSAYIFAADWPHFLEIQEGLLLRVTEIVRASGAEIALPPDSRAAQALSGTFPGERQ